MATEEADDIWPTAEDRARNAAQAARLKAQAAEGGLRFEAYLTPDTAVWLLELIEKGTFLDPQEAAFVIFKEAQDLHPHADLRHELLKRMIQASIDDPRPSLASEEVLAQLKQRMVRPLPEPAVWERR